MSNVSWHLLRVKVALNWTCSPLDLYTPMSKRVAINILSFSGSSCFHLSLSFKFPSMIINVQISWSIESPKKQWACRSKVIHTMISSPCWLTPLTYYVIDAKFFLRIRLRIRPPTFRFSLRYKTHLRNFNCSQGLLSNYLVTFCFFIRNIKIWNNFIYFTVIIGWYTIAIFYLILTANIVKFFCEHRPYLCNR